MKRQEQLNAAWCKSMGMCSVEIMQALAFALRWADSNPQWISVVDELPPLNGFIGSKSIPVFAVREHKDYVDVGICAYDYEAKDWDTLENVTHWMPLPEPPSSSVFPNNHTIGTACPDCEVAQFPPCDKNVPCCKCSEQCNSRQPCPKKGNES